MKKIRKRYYDIVICNGGTDFNGISLKQIKNLEKNSSKFVIAIIVTNLFKHRNKIINLAKNSKHNYSIFSDTKNISSIMNNSKIALMNGGNTRYELCKTGTPFINVPINNDQKKYSNFLLKMKVCVNYKYDNLENSYKFNRLVSLMLKDVKILQEKSIKMKNLFDDDGKKFLKNLIFKTLSSQKMHNAQ